MNILAIFTTSLLIALASAAPTTDTSQESDKTIITKDFFLDDLVKYTSQHDIIQIVVPLNALNFEDDDDDFSTESDEESSVIFFVEADIDNEGKKDYKGLYVLKKGKATKLLENGRDAAAVNDDSKLVYFAASDGLYVYNAKENKAEKYGTLTDNIIGIAKENSTETLYIVTDNNELYKVTEEGTKKTKLDEAKNVQQIVLDYNENIYFYGEDKQAYVINAEGAKKIEGLPEKPSSVYLLKPPFVLEDSVPFVVDDKVYYVYANGTSELSEFELQAKPTAYGMEATLIEYFAYNKKIYEFNILALILGQIKDLFEVDFFKDKVESIQSIATRSRSDLRP
ncbi:uncharacterized protein ACR2FA_012516 isoform 1-T2 [Aphomia sociella]